MLPFPSTATATHVPRVLWWLWLAPRRVGQVTVGIKPGWCCPAELMSCQGMLGKTGEEALQRLNYERWGRSVLGGILLVTTCWTTLFVQGGAGNCPLFGLWGVLFLEKEVPPSRAACLGRGTGRDTAAITPFPVGAHGYPLLELFPRSLHPKTTPQSPSCGPCSCLRAGMGFAPLAECELGEC